MTHLLFVDIRGLAGLRDAMGEAVTVRAVAELHGRLPSSLAALFDRLGGARPVGTEHPGRWCVAVSCATAEEEEVARQAAQRLVHDLTGEIFGAATGAWARVVADVVAWDGAASPDSLVDAHAAAVPAAVVDDERRQLRDLMDGGGLRTFLQPIVAFPDGRVVGYEALSRGPAGHALERADALFAAAARTGLSHALECACARQAAAWVQRLPAGLWLSVNASVPVLLQADMRAVLGRPGLVVEITEHLPIETASGLLPALTELRGQGALVALDDTGCGFADVAAARILRPDIVKLCITVIRGAGRDPSILPDLARTVDSFVGLGARVLAEGVEDQAQADALAPLDIALAQGWLYARPRPAAEMLS